MIKRFFGCAASMICFFLSSYLLPLFLLIAFNYGKGIQNNEDGIMFIPLGFVLVTAVVIIDVLLIRSAIRSCAKDRKKQFVVAGILLLILAVTVALTFSSWKTFFECLAHYKGLNLSPQR